MDLHYKICYIVKSELMSDDDDLHFMQKNVFYIDMQVLRVQ